MKDTTKFYLKSIYDAVKPVAKSVGELGICAAKGAYTGFKTAIDEVYEDAKKDGTIDETREDFYKTINNIKKIKNKED